MVLHDSPLLFHRASCRNFFIDRSTICSVHSSKGAIFPLINNVAVKLLPCEPFGRWYHAAHAIIYSIDATIGVEKPVPKILTGLGYLRGWIIEYLERLVVLTTG